MTALSTALAHLATLINAGAQGAPTRLPAIATLAADAGVSTGTMWKAVGQLRQRGALIVLPGGGTLVAATVSSTIAAPAVDMRRRGRVELVQHAIRQDIVSGRFRSGDMVPGLKALGLQFGVCSRTCRRALAGLAESGLLELYRRGYRVRELVRARGRGVFVFAGMGETVSDFVRVTERSAAFWVSLSEECRRLNTTVVVVDTEQKRGRPGSSLVQRLSRIHSEHSVFGSVVWSLQLPVDVLRATVRDLRRLGRPVAVYEEGVDTAERAGIARTRGVRTFSLGYRGTCARDMCRYLIGLRHRHAVYFPLVEGDAWDTNRRDSTIDCFAMNGGSVHVMKGGLADIGREMLSDTRFAEAARRIVRAGTVFGDTPDSGQEFYERFAYRHLERQFLRVRYEPVFERALMTTHATAWVCASDSLAIAATAFLRKKGVSVPSRISVVGFDDSIEALGADLTSYNFNVAGTVHAIVAHLMGDRYADALEGDCIEVPGHVSIRATTAAAPDAHGVRERTGSAVVELRLDSR